MSKAIYTRSIFTKFAQKTIRSQLIPSTKKVEIYRKMAVKKQLRKRILEIKDYTLYSRH